MDWIEIVHLRSYSASDRAEAIEAFHQMDLPEPMDGFKTITLCHDITLENDLALFIFWSSEKQPKGRSPLGFRLASAFSTFGQINHSVWMNPVPDVGKSEPAKPSPGLSLTN